MRSNSATSTYEHHATPSLTLPEKNVYQALWRDRQETLDHLTDFPLARPSVAPDLRNGETIAPYRRSTATDDRSPGMSDPAITGQLFIPIWNAGCSRTDSGGTGWFLSGDA
jgi:hypothetical protein